MIIEDALRVLSVHGLKKTEQFYLLDEDGKTLGLYSFKPRVHLDIIPVDPYRNVPNSEYLETMLKKGKLTIKRSDY